MTRKIAQDFDEEQLILFDAYVHGAIDRRGFLERAQKFATATMSACALLAALSPNFAAGQQIPTDDKQLSTETLSFPSSEGTGTVTGTVTVKGRLAKPANATGKLPGVLVIHENRGLNPHIEDITRRLALDNFVAFAPDALTPVDGYPGSKDKARELFATLDQTKARQDFLAAATFLQGRSDCTGKIGAVGFCYGGGMAHTLATQLPGLGAAVPFYGNQPAPEEAAKVKAPLLIHFAAVDERINASWPAYEAAAAKLAWGRTIAFFSIPTCAPAEQESTPPGLSRPREGHGARYHRGPGLPWVW